MHDRILKRMRELVRRRCYVMTTHADEEADEDGLSVLDIESVILRVQSSNDNGSLATRRNVAIAEFA